MFFCDFLKTHKNKERELVLKTELKTKHIHIQQTACNKWQLTTHEENEKKEEERRFGNILLRRNKCWQVCLLWSVRLFVAHLVAMILYWTLKDWNKRTKQFSFVCSFFNLKQREIFFSLFVLRFILWFVLNLLRTLTLAHSNRNKKMNRREHQQWQISENVFASASGNSSQISKRKRIGDGSTPKRANITKTVESQSAPTQTPTTNSSSSSSTSTASTETVTTTANATTTTNRPVVSHYSNTIPSATKTGSVRSASAPGNGNVVRVNNDSNVITESAEINRGKSNRISFSTHFGFRIALAIVLYGINRS